MPITAWTLMNTVRFMFPKHEMNMKDITGQSIKLFKTIWIYELYSEE